MKRDGSAPASAPCGKDMAIFPSVSFVVGRDV